MLVSASLLLSLAGGCADFKLPSASTDGQRQLVASVVVMLESTSMAPKSSSRSRLTVTDTHGWPLADRAATWTSLNPAVATVSATGVVTAVAEGTTTVQATVEGATGVATIRVVAPPAPAPQPEPPAPEPPAPVPPATDAGPANLVHHNFNDGSLGPYTNPWGIDLDVVDDPTGSGHGKVARIHYAGSNQDRNRALSYENPRGFGLGSTFFFRGDVYLPSDINTDIRLFARKLLYFQPDQSNHFPEFFAIVQMVGPYISTQIGYAGGIVNGPGGTPRELTLGRWHTIETQVTMNTTFTSNDGIFRLWVDGELHYEKTDVSWSNPAWTANPADQKFRYMLVGDQVNSSETYDEYRYWDNVAFSTRRITP